MSKNPGLVIAFDGPDGVGKSSQLRLTAEWLKSLGLNVHTTRSSGGTPIGEELRKVSLSDNARSAMTDVYITLAMGQAMAEDLDERVAKGQICLIDRSPLTHLAYNTFASQLPDQDIGFEAAKQMFKAWHIDVLLYFEADQSILDKRRQSRTDKPPDYYEKQSSHFHDRVRQGYKAGLDLLKSNPKLVGRVITIDASPDIDTIQASVRRSVQPLLLV